jgi:Family of unknown function (DUF5684)
MTTITQPLFSPFLAQANEQYPNAAPAAAGGGVALIIWLLVVLLAIVSLWKVFSKAGQPGWASIIPIFNLYIWCKAVGRPGWWVILMFIPFVNFIIFIIVSIDMAKSFGKGVGFGVGLAFLGIIFLPILAFGSAQYQGPSVSTSGGQAMPAST